MNAIGPMKTALMIDESKKIFKVSRRAFVDPAILDAERSQIFDKCWLYLGHGSELAKPGDFVTRQVGGRSILFARDGKGNLKAMLNTCPHRGAQVCREKHGSAKSFQCFYHGWVSAWMGRCAASPASPPMPRTSRSARPPTCSRFRGWKAIAI
jgi:p-cumate 2,3-dioxygenase subunit alpha